MAEWNDLEKSALDDMLKTKEFSCEFTTVFEHTMNKVANRKYAPVVELDFEPYNKRLAVLKIR